MAITVEGLKQELISRAKARHGDIFPCGRLPLTECFTFHRGKISFWYNTGDGSTHVVSEFAPDLAQLPGGRHVTWATIFPDPVDHGAVEDSE